MDVHPAQQPQEYELELDQPEEILRLFRRMAQRHCMLTAHAPGGAQLLLSAVLELDEASGRFLLDSSADAAENQRLLALPELRCMGQLDSVGIRFTIPRPHLVEHDGLPAFSATLPVRMTHLQRREYYRLRLPVSCESWLRIPVEPDPATGQRPDPAEVALHVIDVSAGGVALRVPPECVDGFSVGNRFEGCTLALPGLDPMPVQVRVKHLAERRYEEGPGIWQAGCQFIGADGRTQTAIQRFIMSVERELMARARGGA
ncbi:MAG: flagellar brake protein [Lysobacteraceae bacterium]